jgi:putative ABC transport system substrate-binding protein
VRRRTLLAALGGAIAVPLSALGQGAAPRIGFLHSGALAPNRERVARFRKGLAEAGYTEGRNLALEFRWAEGRNERLPELAADLIGRGASVVVTLSSTPAAMAAHAATQTVPIVFLIAEPPVDLGLVASLNRPGGNATGIITMALELSAKRLDLLRELAPQARMAALFNRAHPGTKLTSELLRGRAASLGIELQAEYADTEAEIETAFAALSPGSSLVVATSPFFFVRRTELAALAARRRVPAIYDNREYAQAGGLMSYGPNLEALWEQAGLLVARILKGERPADLPVTQAATFALTVNARTASDLGLSIPPALLARADEVIE